MSEPLTVGVEVALHAVAVPAVGAEQDTSAAQRVGDELTLRRDSPADEARRFRRKRAGFAGGLL